MRFEYGDKAEEKEMVAFIDNAGDLCIKYEGCAVYLLQDGEIIFDQFVTFEEYAQNNGIRAAFYPGDKITITF